MSYEEWAPEYKDLSEAIDQLVAAMAGNVIKDLNR